MPKEPVLTVTGGDGANPASNSYVALDAVSTEQAQDVKVEPKTIPDPKPWPVFLQNAKIPEIKERFALEVGEILTKHGMGNYCALALLEPEDSIDTYDLDEIFEALQSLNPDRSKDVLLVLLSRGGSIKPAYQISKLCKSFAKEHFIAVVPRQAKSAATLIAIGADEIHMGPLGQLGPIDPQLGNLPALGDLEQLSLQGFEEAT